MSAKDLQEDENQPMLDNKIGSDIAIDNQSLKQSESVTSISAIMAARRAARHLGQGSKFQLAKNSNTELSKNKPSEDVQENTAATIFDELPPQIKDVIFDIQKKTEEIEVLVDSFAIWEHYANSGIILFTVWITWFITYFRISFGWLFSAMIFLSIAYSKNIQRLRIKVKNKCFKEFSLKQMDQDKESVEWLNQFLTRFWVNYEPGLSASLKETIDGTLETLKGGGLEDIRLSEFTLGSQAPRIDGLKTFAFTDQETLIMDLDLSFTPFDTDDVSKAEQRLKDLRNVTVLLLAKIGVGPAALPLTIALRELYLSGVFRVELKFMSAYPHIKSIDMCFLTTPTLDFVLKPLGTVDVNKIGGLGTTIRSAIAYQLDAALVNPVKLNIPLEEWFDAEAGQTEKPVGVLRATIIQAKGIKNIDVGISDPMASIKIGGSEVARTRIITDSLDPEWYETHHIIIYKSTLTQLSNKSDEFRIEILHETPVSVKKLGHTSGLSLSRWIKLLGESESSPITSAKPEEEDGQVEKEEVDDSFTDEMKDDMLAEWGSPLDECGSVWKRLILNQQNVGQVELQLSYFPTFPEVESTAISQMAKKSVCGILAITIHQAKELSTGKASAVTCDVYSGDDLVFSTPPKKRTANPTWEHKHLVYCEDVNLLEYRLALNNRNEALGECLIPVKRALQGDDDWYKIFKTKSGNGGGGKLRVGFKFIPIDLYHSSVDLDKAWWNDPIGFLRVNVKEAKGLTNVELVGYSDPYCKFFIAGRAVGVTHHKENTLNPIWNETFYTIAYSTKEELNFDVFDWNNLQKDKLLGKVTLPLGTLMSYYDKARKSLDQDRIGKIEQDGFEVTLKGERTLSIWCPLYTRDVVEDDGEVVTDQFSKSILGRGAQITSKMKKGLKHTFAAEKKVKQKGSIHFELDFFGVVVPDCIIANNEFANTFFDDLEGIEPPKSAKSNPRSPMDLPAPVSIEEKSSAIPVPSPNPTVEKQSSTSNLKQESTEKPQLDKLIIQQDQKPADPILELTLEESIKQILNKHDSGILRIGLTGGEFNRKVKPYLIVYANGEEFYKSHTVPISSTTPYWHTSVDKFISKFKETVFEMQLRDQLDDEPNDRDPYLGMWKGDFIQELLGKGHFKVPFKQYTVDDISIGALPQVSTVTMSFGFMPVKLDIDMSEKTNMGMLVLDIISAKDLPAADSNGFSDPYCIVSLNGKVLHKTKIHKKTLNPEFNERFEIPIMTKFRSTINIQIMDFNNVQKHEELGHCEIPLAKIVIEEPIFQSLSLDKANKGSLDVGFIFYPQVLDKKWSNLDANDSKLKTETTGLGKFSRGVTSGISDLLGGSRKRSNSKFSNTIGMSQQGSLESISEKAKTTASILPNHLQRPPSTAFDNFTSPSRKSSAESISSYPALTLEDGHSLAGSESRESLALEQRCNVKILGARNLKSVDNGGTSDPYIKVYKSGGKHSLHKTHVIKKNLNPTWDNEVFDANYTDILQFNIFDKNVIQSDVPLGHVEVNLGTLFQSTDTIDSWFSVQGGEGEIHISATTNYNPALKKKTKKSILSLGKRQE